MWRILVRVVPLKYLTSWSDHQAYSHQHRPRHDTISQFCPTIRRLGLVDPGCTLLAVVRAQAVMIMPKLADTVI